MALSATICAVGKKVWWKNMKRHLRKFHFGLAGRCITWCVMHLAVMYYLRFPDYLARPHSHKHIYSPGEMSGHHCVPLRIPCHFSHRHRIGTDHLNSTSNYVEE